MTALATPRSCPLASGSSPYGCDWCGEPLFKGTFCRPWCDYQWRINHVWRSARKAAIQRDNYSCNGCGRAEDLEVNHIVPLRGLGYGLSCRHHQTNLATLCRRCHAKETKAQNAVWA